MYIREVHSERLIDLSNYDIDAAFINLMERANDVGGVHSEYLNKAKLLRPRYKSILENTGDVDFLKSRSFLYNLRKEVLNLPLKAVIYPTISSHFRNKLAKLDRTILIKNLVKGLSTGLETDFDLDSSIIKTITSSQNWTNEIKTALIFHSVTLKGFHNLHHNKNRDAISFLFDDDNPYEKNLMTIQGLSDYFPNYFSEGDIYRMTDFRSIYMGIMNISLDSLKSISLKRSQINYIIKKINFLPKLYGLSDKRYDFSRSPLPNKFGDLSIFALAPLMEDQKAIIKKFESFHRQGIRTLNSFVAILFWDQLKNPNIIKYIQSPDSYVRSLNKNKVIKKLSNEEELQELIEKKSNSNGLKISKKNKLIPQRGSKVNQRLLEKLKSLRTHLSIKHRVPIFMVYSNQTAVDLATICPVNKDELLFVKGFGKYKVSRYGKQILKTIADFQ